MKKLTASILSVSLLFTSSFLNGSIYADNISLNGENVETQPIVEVQNPVVLNFIEQSKDKDYKDNDNLTIIVEINDEIMAKNYSLDVPDISKVKTKEGLTQQLDYASKSQDLLIESFDRMGVSYSIVEFYDTVLNGVAIRTNFEDAKKIASLPEVASVELNRFIKAPEMKTTPVFKQLDESSNKMINSGIAWDRQYSGKGQLIAIIDSGADPNHEIFKNVDLTSARIKNKEEALSLIKSKDLSGGAYFNSKIPFGFNYADRNTNIKEARKSSHGMHVAGIVAANGDKLKGVAPDSQLAIMRVFSESAFFGGTTPLIYNKAIDDAVKLGVDSINMSLGATGTTDGRLEQTTLNSLKKAQEAGIVVAIAIGNDGFMGFRLIESVPSTNPDLGLTSSPGIADISLAVASVDNVSVKQRGILVNTSPEKRLLFMPSDDKEFPKGNQKFVHVNEGYTEDFDNVNVSGKIALIKRGDKPGRNDEYSFAQKVKNAQDNGAIAAIVYNNIDERQLAHMAGFDEMGVTIPSCFISKKDGEFLLANKDVTINIETEEKMISNPNGYRLSSFSSWGVTPEGNLKPDISAPGGEIYSSINDNSYEAMSGTSMASPHVAGGIAVVKEYVEKTFRDVTGIEKHKLIKNILMSTASPHLDSETNAYTSPRGQGAGLLNLSRATRTSVVVLGTNDVSSINLKNIKTNTVDIKGKLRNYSDVNKEFEYYAVLNTDTVKNGKILLQPRLLETTKNNKQKITVPAKATVDFSVSFTLSDEQIRRLEADMPKGFFLEGYVFFESKEVEESINVPFVGFKGEFENLNVIEDSIYDLLKQGKRPYYYSVADKVKHPYTYIASKVSGESIALGELENNTFENPKFEKEKIAFSPNLDGKADEISFAGTFLRNYRDFEMHLYTENDKENPIYKIAQENDFGIKNYFVPGFGGPNLNTAKSHWKWNGKNTYDEVVEDGKYILSVNVKPDGSGEKAKVQKMEFPIIVDTVYPRIVKSNYNKETGEYTFEKISENGSGIRSQTITIGKDVYKAEGNKITIPKDTDISKAILKVSDFAYNTIELPVNKSIRNGTEKTIIVSPIVSVGSVPMNKFKWTVFDERGEVVDPYNLKVGKYRLAISDVQEPYELEDPEVISFEIKEEDQDKVIPVNFRYKNKKTLTISVSKIKNVTMKVVLIDISTGQEYEFTPKSNGQYMGNIPVGRFKTVIRDLSDGYFAEISNERVTIAEEGIIGINPTIRVTKKQLRDVKVNINRNEYNGKLSALFVGKDAHKTTYKLDFEPSESSKTLKLPLILPFNVYITNMDNETHGAKVLEHKVTVPVQDINIELIKGEKSVLVPVERDMLFILINKAEKLKEKDYEINSWVEFEIELEKSINVYKNQKATQEQIDEAAKNLQKAIDNLVSKLFYDKSKLEAKINEAVEIYNNLDENYDEKSKEFLIAAIEGARITFNSKDPMFNTEKHIQDTIDMLDRAIKNLKRKDGKADKSELASLIKQAKELLDNKELYTEESIKNLQTAYDIAKEYYEKDDATETEIKDSVSDLREYINFVESKADKSILRQEIEISDALDLSKYQLSGKAEFRKALEKAKAIFNNRRSLENEIQTAYAELKQKREALRLKGANEVFDISVQVKEKDENASIVKEFIYSKAKVEKANNKYVYTLKFKSVDFELNEQIIKAEISKLKINTSSGQKEINGEKINNDIQFSFELEEKISEQDIELVIDVFEEISADPIQSTILLNW